jgi:hypothetical protein
VFLYEAPEDGGGELDAPAPDAPAPDAPAPEAPAPENAWEGVSQQEWEGTQQFISAAAPFLQNLAAEYQQHQQAVQQQQWELQQQGPQLPEWDPFDENVVQQHFAARVNYAVEQALGPYQGLLGHVAQETSQREAEAALSRLDEQVGAYDRDAALLIAAPLIDSGQDASYALQAAAQYMHELEQRIREDERNQVQQGFQELRGASQGGAPGRIPGVPAAELDKVPTGPRRYQEAMENAMARRRAGLPVG